MAVQFTHTIKLTASSAEWLRDIQIIKRFLIEINIENDEDAINSLKGNIYLALATYGETDKNNGLSL